MQRTAGRRASTSGTGDIAFGPMANKRGQKRRPSQARSAGSQSQVARNGQARTATATATATQNRAAAVRPAASRAPRQGRPPRRQLRRQEPAWLSHVSDRIGIPGGALVLGAVAWLLVLLLWLGGAIGGSFAVFLGTLLTSAVATAWLIAGLVKGKWLLRGTRAGVVTPLAVFLPVFFDPSTEDVFNVPKYTLAVVGALILAGIWVVESVHERRLPTWRNGLQWLVATVTAWTAVSTLTGVDVHVSLLGNYGSYDGLYLMLAMAVLMMSAANAFETTDLRKLLGAFCFGGAGVVALYGLLQLHDSVFHGSRWDFLHWHNLTFGTDIFSTFGNPNHLAGYIAIVLPVVVVVGLGARRWWWRVAASAFSVVLLVELLRTAARGAWVATIVAAAVLALFLAPEILRRPAALVGTVGAVVVLAAGGMVAVGRKFLHASLSGLFQSSGMDPVQQRFQLWRAAVSIGAHHPLTGIGPDNFALVWQQHQPKAWVAALGPVYLANGTHDIFMNLLADQGFVGMLLFVALLAWVAVRSIGAWRRCRLGERLAGDVDTEAARLARGQRVLLAAIAAGITAYVVQAVFNVQQVGLTFCFWLLVGLLALTTSKIGVPDTLRPAVLLSAAAPAAMPEAEGAEPIAGTPPGLPRRRPGGARLAGVPWLTALTAVAVTAIVVVLSLGADGPYRADHAYWAAQQASAAATAGGGSGSSTSASAQETLTYLHDIEHATALNPWEPRYPGTEAASFANAAAHSSGATTLRLLTAARRLYARAVRDQPQPLGSGYAYEEAVVDGKFAVVDKARARTYLHDEVSALRKAVAGNPLDAQYQGALASALKAASAPATGA